MGDDANPCSRTAPCKTFAGAISKTAAAGEINCLDSAGFGALTITKSITVACEGVIGGLLVSGTNGIIINAAATDKVILKGLDFEGAGTGLVGIRVLSAALVHIEDCIIRGFNAGSAFGIQFNNTAAMTFVILRTTIVNNGGTGVGGAIQIRPTAGFTSGVLDGVVMNRNSSGVAVDGFGGASGLNITVTGVTINGNTTGVGILATSTVPANIQVQGSVIANNGTGLQAANAGAAIRVASSIITGTACPSPARA